MRLLTGPAGSGKTTLVLDRLREAMRAGDDAVRLLVPTATMALHLQNRLAREGFVLRRGLIQTLSGFVRTWVEDMPQVADAALAPIVDEAARRVDRTEFARVVRTPGFCASLARTIDEFSSSGCDSARLAGCLPDAPLAVAFLEVYREVDAGLARRGLAMRAKRLELAAERIAGRGLDGIRTIWLDGFHALPDPELRVISALGRHADLTLTLGDTDATEAVRALLRTAGFLEERATGVRPTPALALVRAPGLEREAAEIARRILEQAAAGRPFREIGIIVRAAGVYAPILRSTLDRFGIPARFYFDEKLEAHPVVRFLGGAVDAMLSGWDHARTLAVLRLAPRFADSGVMDRLDFAVRAQVPNTGLGGLKALAAGEDSGNIIRLIDELAGIEEWRSFVLAPRDWAARFRTLRTLFRPDVGPGGGPPLWRSQAAVLQLFDAALDEAAAALEATYGIALEDFWRAVKSVLRLKPLRLPDERRNVVHVLGAHEARQWVLPVVFVCGMVEKQFPQFHPQDAFFPDAARRQLNVRGIRVRTAGEFEREERALFDSAITRATMLVTLSYPEFDARGERNLPSLYLDGLMLAPEVAQSIALPAGGRVPAPPGRDIHAPALLRVLREKTAKLSPTALESYLRCPFQFFGGRVLRLETVPPRPEDRLDFPTQGSIVHDVLAQWWAEARDVEPLFDHVFEDCLENLRIPRGYHTERLRNAMLDDLRAFTANDPWPRAGFQSRMEERFAFDLGGTVAISGRIDRLDVAADGRAYVIDYKYSAAQRTRDRLKDENLLQAPLYLMAAERAFGLKPAGMFYAGLKGGIEYAGWSEPPLMESQSFPENWLARAAERTLQVVGEIRAGRVEPAPANVQQCRYCDHRDVCRFEARHPAGLAEGA
jgi:ATP-dependent helicase/DNAse subunit B